MHDKRLLDHGVFARPHLVLFDLRRLWSFIAATAIFFAASCAPLDRPSPADLLAALPRQANETDLDLVQIVDDRFLSGHLVDSVLDALGKSRSDATVVFRTSATSDLSVGAMAVAGISGADLLHAVNQAWNSAAIISRSEADIQGRRVIRLEARGGDITVAYVRGTVAYLVTGDSAEAIDTLLARMPP
jgi:hypothetical protein